jgi:hypothetical protein
MKVSLADSCYKVGKDTKQHTDYDLGTMTTICHFEFSHNETEGQKRTKRAAWL